MNSLLSDGAVEVDTDPLTEYAQKVFGVSYLYPYQRLVISNIVDADDESSGRQIVVLPTGGGKSLCFQLPASLLQGLTVVVYPLLSLIGDQARRIGLSGLSAAVLKGGQSRQDQDKLWKDIESGGVQIVLTNPEMLAQSRVVERLSRCTVDHLVVDEAHCVSEWGETFRPSYLELGAAIADIAPARVTAFTATASPVVLTAVSRILFGELGAHVIQAVPDRPNIAYGVLRTPSKHHALCRLFAADDSARKTPAGVARPAIVFCRSRRRVEDVTRQLSTVLGWEGLAAYHAGLTAEERSATERWFMDSNDGVLVATCAYGMGVDKSNVRAVLHYDVPPSVEAFLQESGRGGRDGAPASSVVLFGHDDIDKVGQFADPMRRKRYKQILQYCAHPECRREFLLSLLGHTVEACFGCDNCAQRGAAADPAQTRTFLALTQIRQSQLSACEKIVAAVAARPRVYRRSSLIKARTLPSQWRSEETEEIVSHLLRDDRIVTIRRGPWSGRLQRVRRRTP